MSGLNLIADILGPHSTICLLTNIIKKKQKPLVTDGDVKMLHMISCKKWGSGLQCGHIDLEWIIKQDQPTEMKTLRDFDKNQITNCDGSASRTVVINSPRSALIILKNGLTVKSLCSQSSETIIASVKLEGLPYEIGKERVTHRETRRLQHLAALHSQYDAAVSVISRLQLSNLVKELHNRTTNPLSVGQPNSSPGDNLKKSPRSRKFRLLREKNLGLPTAPLIYDCEIEQHVERIRRKCAQECEQELVLKRRLISMATSKECDSYKRNEKAKEELSQRKHYAEKDAGNCFETQQKQRNLINKRLSEIKATEEKRREQVCNALEERDRRIEYRIKARRELQNEINTKQKSIMDDRRLNVKRINEEQTTLSKLQTLEKQRKNYEQQQRDFLLTQLRKQEILSIRQRASEDRRDRAKKAAHESEQQFKNSVMAKQEQTNKQNENFKKNREAYYHMKRNNGVLRDLRSQKIRFQGSDRFDDWMKQTVRRATQAAQEAEFVATQRKREMDLQRERERHRTEDRQIEKERIQTMKAYRSAVLLESQVAKHKTLTSKLDQKRAAALEARTLQENTRITRSQQLTLLHESELRAQKDRTFMMNNNMKPVF